MCDAFAYLCTKDNIVLKREIVVSVLLLVLLGSSISVWKYSGKPKSGGYKRGNWSFQSSNSPLSDAVLGWYTEINGNATDVDHVVALKDAYLSGGDRWDLSQKKIFANDPLNHVAAVPYVNQTLKSAFGPLKFITKLRNSSYVFANGKCEDYIDLYVLVKKKYGLNFRNNQINTAKVACR